MERFPFHPDLLNPDTLTTPESVTTTAPGADGTAVTGPDWCHALPVLTGQGVVLRELCTEDAPALMAMLSCDDVSRFVSPLPATIEGFERFISWTHRERKRGNYVCFAVVPVGLSTAVGVFQVRSLEQGFGNAEWGFALGSGFWGTGIFVDAAALVADFTFTVIGAHRLEARAAIANGRGNGALRKIGAIPEGVLRRSFLRDGEYHDQVLWSILAKDWQFQRARLRGQVH